MSSSIHEELTREEARLKQLDDERAAVLKNISKLRTQLAAATSKSPANQQTAELSPEAKISLFRSLFKGRETGLELVHSNSFLKDGVLTVEYRQPSDFIAKLNTEYAQKMAVSREKNGHCPIWLPFTDSNHGQGD